MGEEESGAGEVAAADGVCGAGGDRLSGADAAGKEDEEEGEGKGQGGLGAG